MFGFTGNIQIAKTISYSHVFFLKKLDYLVRRAIFGSWGRLLNPVLTRIQIPKTGWSESPRILFLRPGGIGDAVLLVPVIGTVKGRFPGSRITVIAERRNVSVFRMLCGFMIDEVLCYDDFCNFIKIVVRSFDVVIDTEQWHVLSGLLGMLLARRKGIRIGFATDGRGSLFSHPVFYDDLGFEGDNFFRLLEPLGIEIKPIRPYSGFYPIRGRVRHSGRKKVVLFPGASIRERRWPPWRFHEVAKWLISKGVDVTVVGGREDVEASEIIGAGLPGVKNFTGKTSLEDTARILASSDLLISSDSGIMHLAVAVGTPVVALFGPGIESKWAPRDNVSVIINKRLSCSPCTRYGYTNVCCRDARCIKEISVDEVLTSVEQLLFGIC